LCEGDLITARTNLPSEVRQESQERGDGAASNWPAEGINFEEVEKNLILQAMDQTDYNITQGRRKLLGLTFRTFAISSGEIWNQATDRKRRRRRMTRLHSFRHCFWRLC